MEMSPSESARAAMFFWWVGITSLARRDRPSCHGRPCSRISVSCVATADICFWWLLRKSFSYPPKTNIDRNFLRPIFFCGKRGIRTPGTVIPYVSLANWWFKPLTHLSKPYNLAAFRGANIDQISVSAKFRAQIFRK